MRSIEFTNEIAGVTIADKVGQLKDLFNNPYIIKTSNHISGTIILDSSFLAATMAIYHGRIRGYQGVNSVAWLGIAASKDVLQEWFTTTASKLKTPIDIEDLPRGIAGQYKGHHIHKSPKDRDVVLARWYMNQLAQQDPMTRAVRGSGVVVHEMLHRGFGMLSGYSDINKFCKRIDPTPFKAPWNRWGNKLSHGKDTLSSRSQHGNELGTVEHLMIYAGMGEEDRYSGQEGVNYWWGIPGMSKMGYKQTGQVIRQAKKNYQTLSQGVDDYLKNFAQVVKKIPKQELDLFVTQWAKAKFPSVQQAWEDIEGKDFFKQ